MHQGVMFRWMCAVKYGVQSIVLGDYVVSLAKVQDAVDVHRFERLAERLQGDEQVTTLRLSGADLGDARGHLDRWWGGDRELFGHQMARFYRCEGVLLDVELAQSPWDMTPRARWVQHRWRSSHDMRHVLLGLGTTVHEELLLHVFQLGQHVTWMSLALMVPALILGALEGGRVGRVLRHVPGAWKAGRRAKLVVAQPLEELLDRPLSEVRERLGIRCLGGAFGGDGGFVPVRATA